MEHFGFPSMERSAAKPEELPVVLRERAPLEDAGAGQPRAESLSPTGGGDAAADSDAAVSGDERTGGWQSPGAGASDPEAALAAVLAHASGKPVSDTGE